MTPVQLELVAAIQTNLRALAPDAVCEILGGFVPDLEAAKFTDDQKVLLRTLVPLIGLVETRREIDAVFAALIARNGPEKEIIEYLLKAAS